MYMLASEHYGYLNNTAFIVPSIIVTSLASFLSFAGNLDHCHPCDNAMNDDHSHTTAVYPTHEPVVVIT